MDPRMDATGEPHQSRVSKGDPVPYTAPDYDPDGSGRPPADVPSRTTEPAFPAASAAAGEQTALGKEPEPYVDPAYDPDAS